MKLNYLAGAAGALPVLPPKLPLIDATATRKSTRRRAARRNAALPNRASLYPVVRGMMFAVPISALLWAVILYLYFG